MYTTMVVHKLQYMCIHAFRHTYCTSQHALCSIYNTHIHVWTLNEWPIEVIIIQKSLQITKCVKRQLHKDGSLTEPVPKPKSYLLLDQYSDIFFLFQNQCWHTVAVGPQSARLSVPSSELCPPTSSTASECVSPLGGGGGGTQFRRRDRHSSTLCVILSLQF
jgi:hypothetical protein